METIQTTFDKPIIVCTHCGCFHSDEILACALLRIAAADSHVAVIRSRNPKDWERADLVVDVGGKYDKIKFFDHHQLEGAGSRDNGLEYSAFGLIWKHFGITAIKALLAPIKLVQLTDQDIADLFEDIHPFVTGIDGHDQANLDVVARHKLDKTARIEVATLQSVITGMNPISLIEPDNEAENSKQFYKALDFAHSFLKRFILKKISKSLGYKYAMERVTPDPVLILETYCDWHAAVASVNKQAPLIKYVVYPSSNGKGYSIQAVKGRGNTGSLLVPFPANWAGINDGTLLSKLTGIETALFCHRDRFMAACSTLDDAIKLANKSIQLNETKQTN